MRKVIALVIVFGILILSLTSCTVKLGNDSEATTTNSTTASASPGGIAESTAAESTPAESTPAESTAIEAASTTNSTSTASADTTAVSASENSTESSGSLETTEPSTSTAASGQDITPAAEETVDESMTLESLKKGAQDAGYKVEDNKDMQERVEPKPVNGFLFNYQDENSMSQVPVYEFSNSADAKSYAGQVNKEGYCLCITNGKFLGIIGSKYGIVLNDKEKAFLETLFKNKVMAYEEPAPAQASSNKDFAGACTRATAIYKALDILVNKSVLLYSKTLPSGEQNNIGTISFSMASSSDMSFVSALSEDQAKIDEVVKLWEYFGCTDVKVKHDVPNDYTMTGKRAGMDTSFNIHCTYSPETDSLRIFDKDGAQIADYYEFVLLGADKYAIQNLYERAIVEYKDDKIASLIYSLRPRTNESAYKPDADSIYPDGKGIDDAWVSKLGKDKYEQFITFDGTKLQISAADFTGKKVSLEMEVK